MQLQPIQKGDSVQQRQSTRYYQRLFVVHLLYITTEDTIKQCGHKACPNSPNSVLSREFVEQAPLTDRLETCPFESVDERLRPYGTGETSIWLRYGRTRTALFESRAKSMLLLPDCTFAVRLPDREYLAGIVTMTVPATGLPLSSVSGPKGTISTRWCPGIAFER